MEDKLFLNTKLFGGIRGIIGRRDFFLNIICLLSISLVFTLPYSIWQFNNIENIENIFDLHKTFIISPLLIKIWLISGLTAVSILKISNIFRRTNDIQGSTNEIVPVIFSALNIIATFNFLFPVSFTFMMGIMSLNTLIFCILLFKKGKITSNYPYDFTKEFNWGAFLGTWIWGLINNVFVTLWWFIIFSTPWSIYFAIYCGLKGNEWAYKNKKWNNVEDFNKNQEKQATIFAVILGVVIPALYFMLVFAVIMGMYTMLSSEPKTDEPDNLTKSERIEKRLDNMMTNAINKKFVSYQIGENENKFIIKEADWKELDYNDRAKVLKNASEFAAREKSKNQPDEYFSGTIELPKTKIYGESTGKLLAEFKGNFEGDMDFKDIVKEALQAYRFYNP